MKKPSCSFCKNLILPTADSFNVGCRKGRQVVEMYGPQQVTYWLSHLQETNHCHLFYPLKSYGNPLRIRDEGGKRKLVPFRHSEPFWHVKELVSGEIKKKYIDPATRYVERQARGGHKKTKAEYYEQVYNPLTFGNLKLADSVAIFDLPAGNSLLHGTCGRKCVACYAIRDAQGQNGEDVQVKRMRNLQLSMSPHFKEAILTALEDNENATACRVHSSGDFYSQEYINKWVTIAREALTHPSLKHVQFYAYTKRMNKDTEGNPPLDFSVLKSLKNFTVIDSFHWGDMNYGGWKYLHALAKKNGYKLKSTLDGGNVCPCWYFKSITKQEFEAMTPFEREQFKVCGRPEYADGCTYCQTKKAQHRPTVFLIHGVADSAIE